MSLPSSHPYKNARPQKDLAASTQPLKCVAQNGMLFGFALAVTYTSFKGRRIVKLGKGGRGFSDLRLVFSNFYQTLNADATAETDNPEAVTITKAAIVYNGIMKPVTFSGSAGITIASGAVDVQSDSISPAIFGVERFAPGATIEYRWGGTVVSTSSVMLANTTHDSASDQAFEYDAGSGLTPDDVYSTGIMTADTRPLNAPGGTAITTFIFEPTMIVGRADSTFVSIAHCGDSIANGSFDYVSVADGSLGGGWMRRAAYNAGLAYCNFTKPSMQYAYWAGNSTKRSQYFKYFTHGIWELGTNDIQAADASASTIEGYAKPLWSAMYSAGVGKVYQTCLLPRVTSTDFMTSLAGQTPMTGFGNGEARDTLHTDFAGYVGTFIDGFIDFRSAAEESTDHTRWALHSFASQLTDPIDANDLLDPYVGARSCYLAGAPPLGEALAFDPNGANGEAPADCVRSVTPDPKGYYVLSTEGSATLLNTHDIGAVVRAVPTADGTHPCAVVHGAIATAVASTYAAFVA